MRNQPRFCLGCCRESVPDWSGFSTVLCHFDFHMCSHFHHEAGWILHFLGLLPLGLYCWFESARPHHAFRRPSRLVTASNFVHQNAHLWRPAVKVAACAPFKKSPAALSPCCLLSGDATILRNFQNSTRIHSISRQIRWKKRSLMRLNSG